MGKKNLPMIVRDQLRLVQIAKRPRQFRWCGSYDEGLSLGGPTGSYDDALSLSRTCTTVLSSAVKAARYAHW